MDNFRSYINNNISNHQDIKFLRDCLSFEHEDDIFTDKNVKHVVDLISIVQIRRSIIRPLVRRLTEPVIHLQKDQKSIQEVSCLLPFPINAGHHMLHSIVEEYAREIKDEQGNTELMWAVYLNDYDHSKKLLEKGADANTYNFANNSPLNVLRNQHDSIKKMKKIDLTDLTQSDFKITSSILKSDCFMKMEKLLLSYKAQSRDPIGISTFIRDSINDNFSIHKKI